MSNAVSAPPLPALEMRHATIGSMRDPVRPVIEEVDWTVAAGDFWVIGGVQGEGKTDFMMVAGGLMGPLSGSYSFFGRPMPIFEEERLRDRLELGLVFENGQLFNHLTVSENIALPLRYHENLAGLDAEPRVRRLLELTELAPWADSTPGAIGRNWQKRVGLARALMLKPRVLLVDNPLAGLDLRHRGWWLRFLDELASGHDWMDKRPVTLVITTDDLRPWRNRASHFAFLKAKRLVVLGSWASVEAAADPRLQELLAGGQAGG